MKIKEPKKLNRKTPELPGWTFFPFTTNLYMRCQKCNRLPGEMFYRTVKVPGSVVPRTESVCVDCSVKFVTTAGDACP